MEIEGFVLNPYDPCVANKTIQGEQCTVCWYVDDTKVSHKKPEVVTMIIGLLETRFGKMTVKRGKYHTFVGMNFELADDRKIKILMDDYITECIEAYEQVDDKIEGKAATPAKHDLFDVDNSETPLEDIKADIFHHIVGKLLYVSKRARIDVDLAV